MLPAQAFMDGESPAESRPVLRTTTTDARGVCGLIAGKQSHTGSPVDWIGFSIPCYARKCKRVRGELRRSGFITQKSSANTVGTQTCCRGDLRAYSFRRSPPCTDDHQLRIRRKSASDDVLIRAGAPGMGTVRCGRNAGYPGLSCLDAVFTQRQGSFLHLLQNVDSIQKNQSSYCTILIDERRLVCYIIVSMQCAVRSIELIRERKMFLWIAK